MRRYVHFLVTLMLFAGTELATPQTTTGQRGPSLEEVEAKLNAAKAAAEASKREEARRQNELARIAESKRRADAARQKAELLKQEQMRRESQRAEAEKRSKQAAAKQHSAMAKIEILSGYECKLLVSKTTESGSSRVIETTLASGAKLTREVSPGSYSISCSRPAADDGTAELSRDFAPGQTVSIAFALPDFVVPQSKPISPSPPLISQPGSDSLNDPKTASSPPRTSSVAFPFQPVVKKVFAGPMKLGNSKITALLLDVHWDVVISNAPNGTYSAQGTLRLQSGRREIPMPWSITIQMEDGIARQGADEIDIGYELKDPKRAEWLTTVGAADLSATFELHKWLARPAMHADPRPMTRE